MIEEAVTTSVTEKGRNGMSRIDNHVEVKFYALVKKEIGDK